MHYKVLHIITELPIGGAQDNTLLTIEYLPKDRYDLTLLSSPGGLWEKRAQNLENCKLVLYSQLMRKINPVSDFITFWRMFLHIRKHKYDVVHTHSSKPGFLGRLAAKLAGTPLIIHTIHGFPFNDFMSRWKQAFYISLERLAEKCTHKLITVSKLNLEKAVNLKLAPRDKFINIYSGIRLEDFDDALYKDKIDSLKEQLGLPLNKKIIGTIGRLSPQKAPHIYIEAAAELLAKYDDLFFIHVGDGELDAQMKILVNELGVGHAFKFIGPRENIPNILSLLDVFVLSSLWEGLGRSMTEAMAMRRVVVAPAVEGIPELVENMKTGILVTPNSISALAEGIHKAVTDKEIQRTFGTAARKRVLADFSARKMADQIDHLYREMLT